MSTIAHRPAQHEQPGHLPPAGMAFPGHARGPSRSQFHAGGALRSEQRADPRRPGWSTPDQVYVPPGWPQEVLPPEAPGWEQSAVSYLLDACPADYRAHEVLRRHPVVLARLAGEFVESQVRATRDALGSTRVSLGDVVDTDVLDSTVQVLQFEGARLVRVRRAILLVEEALRGRVFIRRL